MLTLPVLLATALAPFIGSFLGVVVTRHRSPAAIVIGRSHCDDCGIPLHAAELVPILSWTLCRGRCRYCGNTIGLFYPLIEVAAIAIPVWLAIDHLHGREFWISCTLGWTLLCLSAADIRYLVLPDFLTLPLVVGGAFVNWALNLATVEDCVVGAVGGFLFVFAIREAYFFLRKREGIGLGDAKLLAAAGAWVTWTGLPSVIVIASVSGLVIALTGSGRTRLSSSYRIPFGAFLCGGWWLVWLYGPLVPVS